MCHEKKEIPMGFSQDAQGFYPKGNPCQEEGGPGGRRRGIWGGAGGGLVRGVREGLNHYLRVMGLDCTRVSETW